MKRHVIAALAATLLTTLPALAETRTLEVATTFHGVNVSSGIRATVAGGKPSSVVVDAKAVKDIDELRYEVRDGILYLWYDWGLGNLFDWSGHDIAVTVGSEILDAVESSAGATVEASGLMGEEIGLEVTSGASLRTDAIEGMAYTIEVTSGADLEASGFCTSAKVQVTTGASASAKGLDCATAEVEVTTGAHLEITVKDSIEAEVTTGGHATIHGKPSVQHLETTTGGSVDFPS